MSNSFIDRDGFEKSARLTLAPQLGAVLAAKVRDVANDAPFNDAQKDFIASALWFEPVGKTSTPLPLGEADSFRVSFVSAHDKEKDACDGTVTEPDNGSDNYAVAVHLYREGSPFVYDEDVAEGVNGTEYTVLVGPDAPPTMVHQELLERVTVEAKRSREYSHGRWRDMSTLAQTIGSRFLHMLNDKDCEHVLTAVTNAPVNAGVLIQEMSAAEGFADL